LLQSYFIPGNAGETFVGTETGQGFGGNIVYDYWVDLPQAFDVKANTMYWMSIVPDLEFQLDPNNVTVGQWGWHSGTGGDGYSVQDFLGDRFFDNPDMAFALTSLPEPSSIVLCSIFGATLLGAHLRRRKLAKTQE
jgi:hypothetical protein